ncbi:uncharacterized protein PAC_16928 [Phialocephala subalpina]|uniref:DUF6590 domain-containing protein n=1 Tax=Phialocephala subalpina TaxID=576137 RepID=A0A1L7XPR9_9HELO|nr:uncharacterized protein PAC_16928 [Phialocephala subalpina]
MFHNLVVRTSVHLDFGVQDEKLTIYRKNRSYSISRTNPVAPKFPGEPNDMLDTVQQENIEVRARPVGAAWYYEHYKCKVEDCAAGVKSWNRPEKLKTHYKTWHSYSCEESGCVRGYPCGFESAAALETHRETVHRGTHSGESRFQDKPESPANTTYRTPDVIDHAILAPDGADTLQKMKGEEENQLRMTQPLPVNLDSSYSYERGTTLGSVSSENAFTNKFGSLDIVPREIRSRSSLTKIRRRLDSRFKVQPSSFFVFGRIFKVLWSEPTNFNDSGTECTVESEAAHGASNFNKPRPFLVVDNRRGHCICLPIATYGGQGTMKAGVHKEDHAIVYSSKTNPGCYSGDEHLRKSIRVEVIDPADELDPASRLNYGKLYTVEHNVKVCPIGRVARTYEQQVVDDYNDVHPPVADRPYYNIDDEDPHYSAYYDTGDEDPQYSAAEEEPSYDIDHGQQQHTGLSGILGSPHRETMSSKAYVHPQEVTLDSGGNPIPDQREAFGGEQAEIWKDTPIAANTSQTDGPASSLPWSQWEWDIERGRWKRWRATSKGETVWEWEKLP